MNELNERVQAMLGGMVIEKIAMEIRIRELEQQVRELQEQIVPKQS